MGREGPGPGRTAVGRPAHKLPRDHTTERWQGGRGALTFYVDDNAAKFISHRSLVLLVPDRGLKNLSVMKIFKF